MKNYFTLLLLMISITVFSQKKNEDTLTIRKSKLSEVKYLSEFVNGIPKDCNSIIMEISCKVKGKVMISSGRGDELHNSVRVLLKKVEAGSMLYVETQTECPEKIRRLEKFKVTE